MSKKAGVDKDSEVGSKSFRQICESMEAVALKKRDQKYPNRPSLVGLASPQIGAFVRIILFDAKATALETNPRPDIRFIINPKIVSVDGKRELGREGCYSTSDIRAVIWRHSGVKVQGLDRAGKPILYDLHGFQARIVQHEIDHLNGIRCPDRIESPKQLHQVIDDEFQDYREHWASWDKYYAIDNWLRIKRGEK
jgi:peptide deformylase